MAKLLLLLRVNRNLPKQISFVQKYGVEKYSYQLTYQALVYESPLSYQTCAKES